MIAATDDDVVASVKSSHAGLMTLVCEAARTNATGESMKSILEETGLRSLRAGALAKGYEERVTAVREQLRSNVSPPLSPLPLPRSLLSVFLFLFVSFVFLSFCVLFSL
jgi:hypothetical protein